ncbi:hypothetical protein [Terriglobus sp. RCC_193]|uniref:hypothetical protein n=1 Tax=Terriglobus sp. RCC_193 TaxID=3239218 RepID=UPI0035232C36
MLDSMQQIEGRASLRRERFVVLFYVFCSMLVLARVIRERWAQLEQITPTLSQAEELHHVYAPEAYRVGIPFLMHLVKGIVPGFSLAGILASFDFLFGSAALILLYSLVASGYSLSRTAYPRRVAAISMALAAAHFPFVWTMDWLRNVTIPSAFFLVCAVWILQRVADKRFFLAPLLLLSAWQGVVRSDVAFTLGAALFLLAVCGLLDRLGPRWLMVGIGAAIALIAGGVQLYMQRVAFPHLIYPPGTPVFMWRMNLTRTFLVTFVTATLPVVPIYWGAFVQRRLLRPVDWICLGASLLYLPLWYAVGSIKEIRIFVPFYLLLVIPAASIIVRYLLQESDDTASSATA